MIQGGKHVPYQTQDVLNPESPTYTRILDDDEKPLAEILQPEISVASEPVEAIAKAVEKDPEGIVKEAEVQTSQQAARSEPSQEAGVRKSSNGSQTESQAEAKQKRR